MKSKESSKKKKNGLLIENVSISCGSYVITPNLSFIFKPYFVRFYFDERIISVVKDFDP